VTYTGIDGMGVILSLWEGSSCSSRSVVGSDHGGCRDFVASAIDTLWIEVSSSGGGAGPYTIRLEERAC
jgi:hypothetical protein